MEERAGNQNKTLLERTRIYGLLLVGFVILTILFGTHLVTTESPKQWKEVDATITDIQYVSKRLNRWQLTDTAGNTYTISGCDEVIEQILLRDTYHIVYSPNFQNGIRSMTQGNTILVDYAYSVSVYSERSIWDWVLCFVGVVGSWATIVVMVRDIRKAINRKTQKQ